MPIEDLDFLFQNSVKENIIILIDSDKRDKKIWVEPNQFQIDFVEPFKFIYGIDILDVNIPRTMYSIESYNNSFTMMTGSKNPFMKDNYTVFPIDARDYNIQEFIEELNNEENGLYLSNIFVEVPITRVNENRKSILRFVNSENPPTPFVFDMKESTISTIIGFNSISQDKHHDKYLKLKSNENDFLFASVPNNATNFDIDVQFTNDQYDSFMRLRFHNQPLPLDDTLGDNLDDDDIDSIENPYIYSDISRVVDLSVGVSFFLTGINVKDNYQELDDDFAIYELDLSNVFSSAERDAVVSQFEVYMRSNLNDENMFDINNTVKEELNLNVSILTRKDVHKFKYNAYHVDTQNNDYIFNMIPIRCVGNVLHYIYSKKLCCSNIHFYIKHVSSFSITSPGIVKLYGERYVTIHCDEIENHLRGSLMYNDYSPGLALVNLGIQGYSQSRNDFYGVAYKEFHPIGKLNSLKFTVKKSDGALYDFKNVNWHMLISVKYYVPKNTRTFNASVLNPNYNYNFIEYQLNRDALNNKDDSEYSSSDDDIDDVRFRNEYLKKEQELRESYQSEYSDTDDDINSNDE